MSTPDSVKSILVVEDEPAVLALASMIVKRANYRAIEASDGMEALAILQGGVPVDAIISDIMMPRMSGVDLVKTVREMLPEIPVLFISGYAGDIHDGTKGLLQVSDFVLPFSGSQTSYRLTRSEFVINGCRADMHEGGQTAVLDEPSNNAPGSQESGLFQTFSQLVLSGQTDPRWSQISLLTQRVLDACLRSARQGGAAVLIA